MIREERIGLKKFISFTLALALMWGVAVSTENAAASGDFSSEIDVWFSNGCGTADITIHNNSGLNGGTCTAVMAAYEEEGKLAGVKMERDLEIPLEGLKTTVAYTDFPEEAKLVKVMILDNLGGVQPIAGAVYTKYVPTELKILSIGNSYSADALQLLYKIAEQCGVKLTIGFLAIAACSLETHWTEAQNSSISFRYSYYKNIGYGWQISANKNILHGLLDEDWDIITLQQASLYSGDPSTYEPYLTNLVNYIRANMTNPDAKLGWHMTWAYQQGTGGLSSYGNSQTTMYNAICAAVQSKVATNTGIDFIIPAGTAVQNVRISSIGDTLSWDGVHLNALGSYTAAMTWAAVLAPKSIDNVTWVPVGAGDYLAGHSQITSFSVTPAQLAIIKNAVKAAL